VGFVYENCYKILSDVRHGLNEHSSDLVTGTATHGKYKNDYLISMINTAQNYIWALLMKRSSVRGIFVTSTTVTGSNSVFALPSDFGKLIQFEDENYKKVWPTTIKMTPVRGETGADRVYYRQGNNLILFKSGISQTYTFKYYKKPRYITMGKQQAGSGALAIVLDANAKSQNDYYNDMLIESIPSDLDAVQVDTITDYVGSTKTATVTLTGSSSKYYGLVSDLPEVFHEFIAPWAVLFTKATHPASQEKPSKAEAELLTMRFDESVSSFAGGEEDVSQEDIWCAFTGDSLSMGVEIPGQGYLIFA